jgi:hypothetical protein
MEHKEGWDVAQFRDYIDKSFTPKLGGPKNTDREILVNFINNIRQKSLEEGRERALMEVGIEAEKLQTAFVYYENDKGWNALERFKDVLAKLRKEI